LSTATGGFEVGERTAALQGFAREKYIIVVRRNIE
jgi:hypothetical protein